MIYETALPPFVALVYVPIAVSHNFEDVTLSSQVGQTKADIYVSALNYRCSGPRRNIAHQRLKSLQWQRSAKEIALVGVAIRAGQKFALRINFNTLGYDALKTPLTCRWILRSYAKCPL